jgi:hypothetical protein
MARSHRYRADVDIRRGAPIRAACLIAALLAGVTAAGCSGNAVNTGPFGGANWNTGVICTPLSHVGELVTDGFISVRNSYRGTVAVISRVGLVRPHDAKLLRAYAVRLHDMPLYGVETGLPPHGGGNPSRYPWSARVDAVGARVPHFRRVSIDTNLLLVIRTRGRHPGYQGISVWYHVGSQQYQLRTGFAVHLPVGRCK